jgi:hypothetical protein
LFLDCSSVAQALACVSANLEEHPERQTTFKS